MLNSLIKNWKQILVSVAFTIAIMVLCAPMYLSAQFLLDLKNNNYLAVIYNDGFQNNTLRLKSQHEIANNASCSKKGTFCSGYMITDTISHRWKNFNFQLEVVGDGTFYVDFGGPGPKKYKNLIIEPIIDYRNFVINGNKIFSDARPFHYNEAYQKSFDVKNGDIINISVDIRKHVFDVSQVDKLIFLSVLILSFLFSYKLTQFAAKFKLNSATSRIDIVFLAIFICLLFIPMSHISNENISTKENRTLAEYPDLLTGKGINTNFGEQFNSWFDDRFLGRKSLLSLYGIIKYSTAPYSESDKALIGDNGFLWAKHYHAIQVYCNNNLFTQKELKTSGEHIKNFVNAAKRHGIKEVYFMLSNDKESMYSEYYPKFIRKVNRTSRLEQLLNYVHANYPEIKFYNFKDAFDKIKKDETIFYKTGTHMNNIGAFYEYYFLTNEIKKDFPDTRLLTPDDFYTKISDNLKQPELDLDTYNLFTKLPNYEKSNFKNKILFLKSPSKILTRKVNVPGIKKDRGDFVVGINSNAHNNLNAFVIGDSFMLRYYRYLLESFFIVERLYWGYGFDFRIPPDLQNFLKRNIPDILIVETTERYLQRFLTLEFPNLE